MNNKSEDLQQEEVKQESTPDEQSGFYFSSFVKIHDPNTKEVLLQTRGDE